MAKKQSKTKTKVYLMSLILAVTTTASISYLILNQQTSESSLLVQESVPNRPVVYPTMYNREITKNATISDPRFRKLSSLRKDSLLANTISSVKKNDYIPQTSELEHGSWLWTPTLEITPGYRDSIISGAKRNGIKNIYISIDSYLDIYVMENGKEKEEKQKVFDNILRDFIKKAHANGLTVDAEAGWKNWAEDGHTYKPFAILDYVIDFNNKYPEKFRGFQYDVEPYVLSYYEENKRAVLFNFINLIDETVARLDGSDLQFTVVVPEFYDGQYGLTPKFSYAGIRDYTINHLLGVLDRRPGSKVIVMSYRNFSLGYDGSIEITQGEIDSANRSHSKIIIAQETGEVDPSYITFHNTSKSYFNKQLNIIRTNLRQEKSYGGTAVHYINAFLDLK